MHEWRRSSLRIVRTASTGRTKRSSNWSVRALCLLITLGATFGSAVAQGLSSRAVTIVVPYTPGTGPDVVARTVGDELQKRWRQPVVVDNRPGATGNIGTQMVARAAPDGHTLLLASNPFTSNVSLFTNLPYDPIKSFAPIISMGAGALALCVNPAVPATNLKEFVTYAKFHQGQLNYASPGIGATPPAHRFRDAATSPLETPLYGGAACRRLSGRPFDRHVRSTLNS